MNVALDLADADLVFAPESQGQEQPVDELGQPYDGSVTFLNMSGDITVVWDEQNRDKVLEVIRRKMSEGYVFFTTKKFMFKRLTKKAKITEKNIDVVEEVIITDEQFEKMVQSMDDRDVATLVRAGSASMAKRTEKKKEFTTLSKAKSAEDVVQKGRDSVAVRPIAGG